MKRLFSLVSALAAVSLLVFAVSCKQDKKAAEEPFAEPYTLDESVDADAAFATVLPDNPDGILALRPFVLLDKSGFLTEAEFAADRERLLGLLPESAAAALLDPASTGVDVEKPLYIAMMLRDLNAIDYYLAIALQDSEAFVSFWDTVNDGDRTLTPGPEGAVWYVGSKFGLVVGKDAALLYYPQGRVPQTGEIEDALDAAAGKSAFHTVRPGVSALFASKADAASWSDLDAVMGKAMAVADKDLKPVLGQSIEELLGGNPFRWLTSVTEMNCLDGKIVSTYTVIGENPLFKRMKSWFAKADPDLVGKLPAGSNAAVAFALQNTPDLLAYAQEVLDRSGKADGMNIADALRSVGVEAKELEELGTVAAGVQLSESFDMKDHAIVVDLGEALSGNLRKKLPFLTGSPEKIGTAEVFNLGQGILILDGTVATVVPPSIPFAMPEGGFQDVLIAEGGLMTNGLLRNLGNAPLPIGNGLVAALLPALSTATAGMDWSFTANQLVVWFQDGSVNAMRSIARVVSAILNATDDGFGDDDDFDFDDDFDYLY